jgi:hypothetical protein
MSFAERLKNVRTIVTHEGCPDGIASAILCHDALPQAEIVWLQYGTAKRRELPATEGMLFVDMTPEPSRNQEFVDAGAIVLDHALGRVMRAGGGASLLASRHVSDGRPVRVRP